MTKSINIVTLTEHEISGDLQSQLAALLEECFPNWFAGRTYVKQLPHLRILAMDAGIVVGQVSIDGRIINVGGKVLSIFGVLDVAVSSDRQGNGIASTLLAEVERLARTGNREFLVVMADRQNVYLKNGYSRVQPARTKLLAIEDRQSVAVIEKDLSSCFMIKPLTERAWPQGTIDLLGYVF